MQLIPAIDLKDGKCVRLYRGRFDQATVYGDDPALTAIHWEGQGARLIHLVDLDASLGRDSNRRAISSIRESVKAELQLGGGMKSMEAVDFWLGEGIDRVIMGTALSEDPRLVERACSRWPGRIAAAVDAEGDRLKTWGWQGEGPLTVSGLLPRLKGMGLSLVIYTDTERDGTQEGPNIPSTVKASELSGLPTVISGGISSLDDLIRIRAEAPGLFGAISGKALYAKTLDFREGAKALL
jgi:phosphoribosylformimino-5-aminoimidazole carboxamide ribotide isomerase